MKANYLKSLAAAVLMGISSLSLFAQEESSNFSFGADLVSRYVWRGINLGGSAPHVQPYIEYAFGESGLAIGAWGSHATGASSTGAEADLYLTYSFLDMFTIGVTDYFFPSDRAFAMDDYFDYDNETTGHTIEIMAGFNGTEDFPLSLLFAMNVYGADGVDAEGESYNAKYLELGYSTSLADTDLSLFMGAALDNPDEEAGAVGWYGDSAGIINLGMSLSKSIPVTDMYSLPVSSSLIVNPVDENIYLVFGVSF